MANHSTSSILIAKTASLGFITFGTPGADSLTGTDDVDVTFGAAGDDTILGQGGADVLLGEAGRDLIDGGAGDDVMDGGAGADSLLGRAGDDVLAGGDGIDTLRGGEGDDVLSGGAGIDRMYGGAGRDTVTYSGVTADLRITLTGPPNGGPASSDLTVGIEDASAAGVVTRSSGPMDRTACGAVAGAI